MNNRVLFMIINGEVKYLQNSDMDHREWYTSMGLDPSLFESIVRGYVLEHKIVFFKGLNFNYDEEVIQMARMYSPSIREVCQDQTLEVYCGIVVNSYGEKWEPVLRILDSEITGFSINSLEKQQKPKKIKEPKETGPVLEFKNESVRKRAIIITGIVLFLTILIKVVLFSQGKILQLQNMTDVFLAILQVFCLGFTIYGYLKKLSYTKYLGLVSSVLLILTLNIWDVILGILYFLFSIDQGYFLSFLSVCKKFFSKKKSS